MDKVVHFEIPVDDLSRAKGFYSSVFGWQIQTMEMEGGVPYTTLTTTPIDDKQMPTEPGAINGGMMRRTAETPSPVITVGVGSVDLALKEVEANGGSIVTSRTEVPGMGAFGYAKDTEGNIIGVWETFV